MFWVAWKGYNNGKAISLGAVEQAEAEAYGMHGYPTEAEAEAKPNSVNSIEKTQVNAWIVANNDITGNPANDAKHALKAAEKATGTSTAIKSVEDFLTGLTSSNLWIRAAKVLVGGVMILVAVGHMTGADSTVGKVTKHIPF